MTENAQQFNTQLEIKKQRIRMQKNEWNRRNKDYFKDYYMNHKEKYPYERKTIDCIKCNRAKNKIKVNYDPSKEFICDKCRLLTDKSDNKI